MYRLKAILPLVLSLFAYGCNPAWAYSSDELEESNFQIVRECENGYLSLILTHNGQAKFDSWGNIRLQADQTSELMMLPCKFQTSLTACESHRGRFHWSTDQSVIASLHGDAFECVSGEYLTGRYQVPN